MKFQRNDVIVYAVVAALLLGSVGFCIKRDSDYKKHWLKYDEKLSVEHHINHANLYYWFGMYGRGSMAALGAGARQAKQAREKLEEGGINVIPPLPNNDDNGQPLTAKQREPIERAQRADRVRSLKRAIDGIETDIANQQLLHGDTFHGKFPWGHFMAKPTLFSNPRATGSFELLDQPQVIAAREAVQGLIDEVIQKQTVTHQYDVVFVCDCYPVELAEVGKQYLNATQKAELDSAAKLEKQLENEALYLFNMTPRFFVNNYLAVNATLNQEEQSELRNLAPSAGTLRKMRASFGHNDILLVRLNREDSYKYHHFYNAQGRVYKGDNPEPAVIVNNYGFCRDRTHMWGLVVWFNALMLITAVVVFRLLAQHSALDRQPPSWKSTLGLAIIGFLWGRAADWGLAEIVEEFVPEDEVLAILSWWWPVLTGIVILLGPAFILRFAEGRFNWLSDRYGTFNRGGALFAVITLGSATYVGQSALYVRMWGGWMMVPPLIIGTVLIGYLIGRALDPTDAVQGKWGTRALLLALLIGPAYCNPKPSNLWMVAVPAMVLSGAAFSSSKVIRTQIDKEEDAKSGAAPPPESLTELKRKARNPPFQKTATFETVWEALTPWVNRGKSVRVELTGSAGTGKTALINALIANAHAVDARIAIMQGICPEPHEGQSSEPYRPIADAIAEHFSVNLLAPPEEQMLKIDKAVDGIFEEVVPFSDLLFPEAEHGSSGSKSELFHSVVAMLKQLALQQRVLLIVDDTHWIDSGSRELLQYLLKEFSKLQNSAVAIVTASRTATGDFAATESIPVAKLTPTEARGILCDGLFLSNQIAEQLVDAVSGHDDNLHWLFQMVSHLAANEVLHWKDGAFTYKDEKTHLSDHLPQDIRDSLTQAVSVGPDSRPLLECAACIGREFTVEVLAPAVGMSRLECIRALDAIERDTGVIRDVHDKDDTYEFRSSFVLEVLRKILHVNAHGPSQPSPNRIREYHAQLAGAWNSTLERSTSALYRVASHNYAAGKRHAERALEANLTAAHAASAQFQHEQARLYVSMARECAQFTGTQVDNINRELLLIECHEAHVEGTGRVAIADRCIQWLDAHPNDGIQVFVAAAQACYDAGVDTRDQAHFAKAAEIAQQIVDRFEDPLDVAEGFHFLGISLPATNREARQVNLTRALELTESEGSRLDALRLKARIANSLAEQLSYGSDSDRLQARELFLTSIELKSRASIRDIAGLAFAHGGLGRLSFFAPEPDYEVAREHFMEDLRYSEKLGSRTGQSKMHSLLGSCDARQNQDHVSAIDHYRQAFEFADERVDKYFALAGILENAAASNDEDNINRFGPSLWELTENAIKEIGEADPPISVVPQMCLDSIKVAVQSCARIATESDWHRSMCQLLGD